MTTTTTTVEPVTTTTVEPTINGGTGLPTGRFILFDLAGNVWRAIVRFFSQLFGGQ